MTMTEERAAKPYGDVTYADPKNGKYPIDTEEHIRAAWSYINMPKNAATYPLNGVTLESVKSRIRAAMKRIGAEVSADDGDRSAQRDPGWEQRRKRWAGSLVGKSERRGMLLEVRSKPDGTGGTEFVFEGYGSVFDTPFQMWDKWGDPYTEVVKPGAFTRSLARRDLDVPFLIGHDESRLALARTKNGTMHLSQDSHGLHVKAELDGRRSDVRDLAYAVERGDMDEMSIGFVTLGQQWSEDYETRSMLDLDLHRGDVSPVALAAIPETAGSTVSFPTETLSRRAAMTANQVADDADHDHMAPRVAPSHGPVTDTHAHEHPAGDGTMHDHDHTHHGDAAHDHPHPAAVTDDIGTAPDEFAASRPLEHRALSPDESLGNAPRYNPWKNTPGAMQCTNCDTVQSPAANFCDNCGVGGDALVRLNADGVPGMEEEQGAAASLALRRRQLELLALAR